MGLKRCSIGAALGLSACAGGMGEPPHPSPAAAPVTRSHPVARMPIGQVVLGAGAAAKVAAFVWMRPGDWTPVEITTRTERLDAMLSRDAVGARLVTTLGRAGYTVTAVGLNCENRTARLVESRSSSSLGTAVDAATAVDVPRVYVLPEGVGKVCAKPVANGGTSVESAAARVQAMAAVDRKGGFRAATHTGGAAGAPSTGPGGDGIPVRPAVDPSVWREAATRAKRTGRPVAVENGRIVERSVSAKGDPR